MNKDIVRKYTPYETMFSSIFFPLQQYYYIYHPIEVSNTKTLFSISFDNDYEMKLVFTTSEIDMEDEWIFAESSNIMVYDIVKENIKGIFYE